MLHRSGQKWQVESPPRRQAGVGVVCLVLTLNLKYTAQCHLPGNVFSRRHPTSWGLPVHGTLQSAHFWHWTTNCRWALLTLWPKISDLSPKRHGSRFRDGPSAKPSTCAKVSILDWWLLHRCHAGNSRIARSVGISPPSSTGPKPGATDFLPPRPQSSSERLGKKKPNPIKNRASQRELNTCPNHHKLQTIVQRTEQSRTPKSGPERDIPDDYFHF